MPNWTSVVRLLRRRLVLGIIFAMSLTYCAISLLSHEKLGNSLKMQEDVDIGVNDEEDEIFRGSGKHLAWQLELENTYDAGNAESGNANAANDFNDTSVIARTCRNSVQGKALIVDDRGFVCARSEVLPTGCCTMILDNAKETNDDTRLSVTRRRYSCETCNPQGCCAIYEYCVACCLQPNKRRVKKDGKIGTEKERRDSQKSRRGEEAVKLRLRNLDRFQICLAACRTSSASVRHENTYKDPDSKHCYSHYQRNRRDDTNNNNDDNGAVVVTSSSTLQLLIQMFARNPSNPLPENRERTIDPKVIYQRTRCRECLRSRRIE